jgi:hypothetical protein
MADFVRLERPNAARFFSFVIRRQQKERGGSIGDEAGIFYRAEFEFGHGDVIEFSKGIRDSSVSFEARQHVYGSLGGKFRLLALALG